MKVKDLLDFLQGQDPEKEIEFDLTPVVRIEFKSLPTLILTEESYNEYQSIEELKTEYGIEEEATIHKELWLEQDLEDLGEWEG